MGGANGVLGMNNAPSVIATNNNFDGVGQENKPSYEYKANGPICQMDWSPSNRPPVKQTKQYSNENSQA